MPAVIQWLIIGNGLGFLLEQAIGPATVNAFALWVDPSAPFAALLVAPWQLITYGFLHGNISHLLLNMFGLWMFGSELESYWGSRKFLGFFWLSSGFDAKSPVATLVTDVRPSSIARLFLAPDARPLRELAHENLIRVSAEERQDRVAELSDKYNVLTLPVVDNENHLAGVIRAEDVITLLRSK